MLLFVSLGIGEATYSAIGPAMIADMFIGDTRSNMLAMFYFMMLVGGSEKISIK